MEGEPLAHWLYILKLQKVQTQLPLLVKMKRYRQGFELGITRPSPVRFTGNHSTMGFIPIN